MVWPAQCVLFIGLIPPYFCLLYLCLSIFLISGTILCGLDDTTFTALYYLFLFWYMLFILLIYIDLFNFTSLHVKAIDTSFFTDIRR